MAAAQFDRVVIPSQTIAEEVCAYIHCEPVVISNGIDLSRFSPFQDAPDEEECLCRKYGLDPAAPVLLHVGRLDADKNVELLIRAAAQALDLVEAQLVVAGHGKQRSALQGLCADLGISARTHFLGYIDQEGDLPSLYRMATVFATASEIEIQGTVIHGSHGMRYTDCCREGDQYAGIRTGRGQWVSGRARFDQ